MRTRYRRILLRILMRQFVNDKLLDQLPVFDQDFVAAVSNFLDQGATGNVGTTLVVDGMEQKNAGRDAFRSTERED